jgi:hypothetical protein
MFGISDKIICRYFVQKYEIKLAIFILLKSNINEKHIPHYFIVTDCNIM